jgi:hypothetical protein
MFNSFTASHISIGRKKFQTSGRIKNYTSAQRLPVESPHLRSQTYFWVMVAVPTTKSQTKALAISLAKTSSFLPDSYGYIWLMQGSPTLEGLQERNPPHQLQPHEGWGIFLDISLDHLSSWVLYHQSRTPATAYFAN